MFEYIHWLIIYFINSSEIDSELLDGGYWVVGCTSPIPLLNILLLYLFHLGSLPENEQPEKILAAPQISIDSGLPSSEQFVYKTWYLFGYHWPTQPIIYCQYIYLWAAIICKRSLFWYTYYQIYVPFDLNGTIFVW